MKATWSHSEVEPLGNFYADYSVLDISKVMERTIPRFDWKEIMLHFEHTLNQQTIIKRQFIFLFTTFIYEKRFPLHLLYAVEL